MQILISLRKLVPSGSIAHVRPAELSEEKSRVKTKIEILATGDKNMRAYKTPLVEEYIQRHRNQPRPNAGRTLPLDINRQTTKNSDSSNQG
jgi:hypothetical protein